MSGAEAALRTLSFEAVEYHSIEAALVRAITRISTGSKVNQ